MLLVFRQLLCKFSRIKVMVWLFCLPIAYIKIKAKSEMYIYKLINYRMYVCIYIYIYIFFFCIFRCLLSCLSGLVRNNASNYFYSGFLLLVKSLNLM